MLSSYLKTALAEQNKEIQSQSLLTDTYSWGRLEREIRKRARVIFSDLVIYKEQNIRTGRDLARAEQILRGEIATCMLRLRNLLRITKTWQKYSLSCATFETHFLAYHNSHSHHARVERQDNRPFLSSKKSHFQSEAKCEAIDMKMIFNYDAKKLIFTTKVSHLYLSWKWDFLELGNNDGRQSVSQTRPMRPTPPFPGLQTQTYFREKRPPEVRLCSQATLSPFQAISHRSPRGTGRGPLGPSRGDEELLRFTSSGLGLSLWFGGFSVSLFYPSPVPLY